MTNLPDSIISVFLDKQAHVLKDTELCNALVNQGIPCNVDDIRRHVQLLSPSLFQLTLNKDGTQIIRVEPKVNDLFLRCLIVCYVFFRLRCVKIFSVIVARLK
jgi:hypothetical protein